MKLILAVDAIFHPLTGIGRYAWELAQGLAHDPDIDDLRYWSHGRWVNNPTQTAPDATNPPAKAPSRARLRDHLRATLARSTTMVSLYAAITPLLYRHPLRPYRKHVFHSPNYFLPPFDGPAIATVHDLSTVFYPQFHPTARITFMDRELPHTFERAAHIITDTEVVRREVIAHFGWSPEHITAVPLGVDPAFGPREPAQLADTLKAFGLVAGHYILCVATIEPRKNIARLLEAHASLPLEFQRRHPLVLAGAPGWNSDDLHQRIAATSPDTVRYLRYVPQAELPRLYAGAAAFAFPSLYEGFGLPVLEAMASGVPVLTSNVSTLPEVAGGAALLVDPLDTDAIAAGLMRAIHDDDWRAEARRIGLERARDATWARCVNRTMDVYRRFAQI